MFNERGVFMITKAEWKNIRGSSQKPDQIMLSIKGDASRSMTVRWRTDTTVDRGYALYRAVGTECSMKADAEKITFCIFFTFFSPN